MSYCIMFIIALVGVICIREYKAYAFAKNILKEVEVLENLTDELQEELSLLLIQNLKLENELKKYKL